MTCVNKDGKTFEQHEFESNGSVGSSVDRDMGCYVIIEYECANCGQTFTELEQADEPMYDWNDLD